MSFSTRRRDALDSDRLLPHRISSVRSLARLMGEKYHVHRDVIIDLIQRSCGVDVRFVVNGKEIVEAISVLDGIKLSGLPSK